MTSKPATKLRDRLLATFPSDTAQLLVEFGKYLAALEGDYIVFMARKSLKLYELLNICGSPFIQKPVISDHLLDQSLEPLKGKSIQLVDDTLILGTTIGAAIQKFEDAGISEISTHVFAVDTDHWESTLVNPDRFFVRYDQNRMLTFCIDEVTAFSLAGIPYLSDFPVTLPLRLTTSQFSLLHSLDDWEIHNLTTSDQESNDVFYFSILPKSDAFQSISEILGSGLYRHLDIVKLRMYCQRAGGAFWVRFVPVVTIRPISAAHVDLAYQALLTLLDSGGNAKLRSLNDHLISSTSKLRLIQYTVSLAICNLLYSEFKRHSQLRSPLRFDLDEATRLFGPWLRPELKTIHEASQVAFRPGSRPPILRNIEISEAKLPKNIADKAKQDYAQFTTLKTEAFSENGPFQPSILTDLIRAFIGLHQRYELPARNEAKKLGHRTLVANSDEAPYRDRLKFGFPWRVLAESMLETEKLKASLRRTNALSLLLDYLIDVGIAVPILCQHGDVLFRAYRHGEPVQFGDQELGLAYETLAGYLETTNDPSVGRVILEKLLVSLIRVGVAKGFLKVMHGLSGADGLIDVGYYLHGAIAKFPTSETIYADNRSSWLSGYMVNQGVVALSSGRYSLGTRPDAAYRQDNAVTDARQLGWLLGTLSTPAEQGKRACLNQNDLIVLTACALPKHAAGAIAAELKVILDWYSRSMRNRERRVNWSSLKSLQDLRKDVVSGFGSLALHSAHLKLAGYKSSAAKAIVEKCTNYLRSQPQGSFLATSWLGAWSAVFAGDSEEQHRRFDPWIEQLGREILLTSLGLFTMEMAVVIAIQTKTGNAKDRKLVADTARKVQRFLSDFRGAYELTDEQQKVLERLSLVLEGESGMPDPERSFRFGVNWLGMRAGQLRSLFAQIEEVVAHFGKEQDRIIYRFAFWYDIIDSRGRKSGNMRADYKKRVVAFKENVKTDLYGTMKDAQRMSGVIYPWHGPLNSEDDEKNVFVGGSRSLSWLRELVGIVLRRAEAHGVRLRLVAINTDFAGIPAYKYKANNVVEGQPFWEHFSGLKSEIREIEDRMPINDEGKPPEVSLFWMAGDLVDDLDMPDGMKWLSGYLTEDELVSTSDTSVKTKVTGGPIEFGRAG